MNVLKPFACAALLACSVALPSQAALLIATVSGNDCSGAFGNGSACVTSGTYNGTPLGSASLVAKLNPGGSLDQLGAFPSITGAEFSLSAGQQGFITYTYTPVAGDALLQYVAVKGGNFFNIFAVAGSGTDTVYAPANPKNGKLYGVSHISFYGTALPPIPVPVPAPAGLALLGAGLLGLGLIRRKTA